MADERETIAAVATGQLPAALGVLRLSGPEALRIAEEIFTPAGGPPLRARPPRTAVHGTLHDGEAALDDAVLTLWRAPASYTGEDVAELSCHGGIFLLREALSLCLRRGARPAEPGEFTKRAFLNGKLDLTQAEAVADLIAAKSRTAAQLAAAQLGGALTRAVRGLREEAALLAAQIMAHIDYPDEDIGDVGREALCASLASLAERLEALAATCDGGRVLREGVTAALVGRTNVGKSSLMNRLCGEERSIVTEIAGTTRDVVDETVRLDGLLLNLSDTAGLRESADPVEREGQRRTEQRAAAARLLLCVFDGSAPLTEEDRRVAALAAGRAAVAVVNKSDLPQCLDETALAPHFARLVRVSARTGAGLDALAAALRALLPELSAAETDSALLVNLRQRDCVERAARAVREALAAARAGLPADLCEIDLEDALAALGELTGETASETLLNTIFSRFCVGK